MAQPFPRTGQRGPDRGAAMPDAAFPGSSASDQCKAISAAPSSRLPPARLERPGHGRVYPYPPGVKLGILRDLLRQRMPEGIFYTRPDGRLEQELGCLQRGERLIEPNIGDGERFRLGKVRERFAQERRALRPAGLR